MTTMFAALNSVSLAETGSDGGPPELVELIPAGAVRGRDGRSWSNAEPQAVLEHFAALRMDLPVDIEHATELKAPKGEAAPAAGWVTGLELRDGAVWGRIAWNASGRELVASRQYRYLSPVILYTKNGGVIAGLTSVALTNRPNLALQALNHNQGSNSPDKENRMNKAILAALQLPEDASDEQVLAKVQGLQTDLATATNHAAAPSLEKFVPRGDYDAALARAANAEQKLSELEQGRIEADIETAINAALAEGKITPATVEYHKAQCRQQGGLARFAEYVKAAPTVGAPSGLDGKEPPTSDGKALNSDELTICERLGVSTEEYQKAVV